MLNRYLLKHYIQIFIAYFVIFFILAFMLNTTARFGQLSYLNPSSLWVSFYSLLQMPEILTKLLPFIVFFAALTHFVRLNSSAELIILRGAGLSIWQIIFPSCLAAFSIGLLNLFILNPLTVASDKKIYNLSEAWQNVSQISLQAQKTIWFLQKTPKQDVTIGASSVNSQGDYLSNVTFIISQNDLKTPQPLKWYDSEKALLKSGYWLLPKAKLYQSGQEPKICNNTKIATALTASFLKDYLKGEYSALFYELPYRTKLAQSFGNSGSQFATRFYVLLASPFLLIAMVCLAASVSLNFSRYGQKHFLIINGLIVAFFTYVFTVICQNLGEKEFIAPFFAGSLPVILALSIAILSLLYREEG